MYDRLLVPLDGSPLAEEALPHVESLSLKYESVVVLFEAVQPIRPDGYDNADGFTTTSLYDSWLDESVKAARDYLARTAASLLEKGINVVQQEVKVGDAAELIIDEGKAIGADLIVMASHGRSGIKRWFYGSVAERVLRHSSTPVLLIRCAGVC